MGGIFGVASQESCVTDLFFGVDYHSHLGTRRAGMTVYGEHGFHRAIHNIENSPFRTKFDADIAEMEGHLGIGCISDFEPQPLLIQSHLGNYAIATVGKISNADDLIKHIYEKYAAHFQIMSNGQVNATDLVAALINTKDSIVEGIRYAQEKIEGSMTMVVMTEEGLYAARDLKGRTPLSIGVKDGARCVASENFAYVNLGYHPFRELGAGEIALITADRVTTLVEPGKEMKICTFLWVYYGYPSASYEGLNVEKMRYNSGAALARRDDVTVDYAAGVPDSGTAHAVGYANESGVPFERPFIKYTPTWPRSFMPTNQSMRNLIARMKLIPVDALIKQKRMVLIDDSIVRGTQLRETTELLFESGASEVHVRPACPPILYGCKFLNFSRSKSDMDLIARRVIREREGDKDVESLPEYADPDSKKHCEMVEQIRRMQKFTTLRYQRLDDMIAATGIEPCRLCTYCWDGRE